jgi:hypothetical protein
MASHVAATALSWRGTWSVESLALLLFSEWTGEEQGFRTPPQEQVMIDEELEEARAALSPSDVLAAEGMAARLDHVSARELMLSLAAQALAEA